VLAFLKYHSSSIDLRLTEADSEEVQAIDNVSLFSEEARWVEL
jgi:hypothetical protein